MNANELRGSTIEDLKKRLEELLKEQFNLRIQKGTGQLSRPSQMRTVRRDIARVKTVMTELKTGGGK